MGLVPGALPKLRGLELIGVYGLPKPNWRFVRSGQSIGSEPWATALDGWTIRCSPSMFYATGLPSRHRLRFAEIDLELEGVARTSPNVDVFVVYPSWEFEKAGCVLVQASRMVVEAVIGDIAPLLAGTRSADMSIVTERVGRMWRVVERQGTPVLSDDELRNIIQPVRQIERRHVVLEWTITRRGALVFHDWLELASGGVAGS